MLFLFFRDILFFLFFDRHPNPSPLGYIKWTPRCRLYRQFPRVFCSVNMSGRGMRETKNCPAKNSERFSSSVRRRVFRFGKILSVAFVLRSVKKMRCPERVKSGYISRILFLHFMSIIVRRNYILEGYDIHNVFSSPYPAVALFTRDLKSNIRRRKCIRLVVRSTKTSLCALIGFLE